MDVFVDGEDIEYYFHSEGVKIGALATVQIRDEETLVLQDVVFYPLGREHVGAGVRSVREMARHVEQMARLEGFKRVMIEGKRLSGATPGRAVHLQRSIR